MLIVRLTKLSNTHHRFEFVRADGTGESVELETRSFLLHDLIHFAIESEAQLAHSFYGSVARGRAYYDLSMGENESEAAITEGVVGPFTAVAKCEVSPAGFIEGRRRYHAMLGTTAPAWLTLEFAERALARLRRLQGEWKATPFGAAMVLKFEV